MKYFEHQKIHWHHWSPDDVYFKRNVLVKKINANNELNVIGYNSKGAFQEEYDKGIFIHVKDIKQEFPTAHINLWNKCTDESIGNLAYIESRHYNFEWKKDGNTGMWKSVKRNPLPLADEEGYRISLGGTAVLGTPPEYQEQTDIINAVHKFFIDRVLPAKRGTLANNPLTMAA